jgi:TorA maturation chaperone TorD
MKIRERSAHARERAVQRLLEDAAVFRQLALSFRYPDASTREHVASGFSEILAAQAQRFHSGSWSTAFRSAAEAWRAADGALLESEHVRLFLGAGICALRETAYGDGRRIAGRSYELADIAGFYRAFGWKLSATHPHLPDHLAAELEFASVLLVKEAYAFAEASDEHLEITRDAIKAFLESHLGRWISTLVGVLVEHGAPVAYVALADLVHDAVRRQCRRFRIAPQLADGRGPHDFMQEDGFNCPRDGASPASSELTPNDDRSIR